MKNKKILILGHTGFVGRELVEEFKTKKIKFDCYSRSQITYNNKKIKNSPKILDKLIRDNKIIINCVGENTETKYMNSRNYIFVKKILKLIDKTNQKKKLIHISSCAVYGSYFHLKNFLINENTLTNPISKYAKTKLKGERLIIQNKNKKLKYTIIRPSQVVGKNMKAPGFINLSKFIKRRIFVYVSTIDAVRNYVNSKDLTSLIFEICKSNKIKNNIYIISRYSRLKSIVKFIEKNQKIKSYFNFVIPKFLMVSIVNTLRFFNKNFPVNKETIEGLSTTTKIKSNIFKDFKNINLQNINNYLVDISK